MTDVKRMVVEAEGLGGGRPGVREGVGHKVLLMTVIG